MSITIKESCRKSNFLGIDFAHSFIWGDQVRIFIVPDVTAFFCPTCPEYLTFRPFARWMTQQSIRQLEYDLIITMFNVMTSCLVLELIVKARACTGYWKTGLSFEKVSPWSPDKKRYQIGCCKHDWVLLRNYAKVWDTRSGFHVLS